MLRRICPICDHTIKTGNYCSFCKQWVRHPNIINATYYLNERHPDKETGCEYHNPSFERETAVGNGKPSFGSGRTASGNGKPPFGNGRTMPGNGKTAAGRSTLAPKAPAAGQSAQKTSVVKVIFLVIFALMFLFNLLPFFLFMI